MSIIYTPRGRAREYSPKALNIYLSCTHGCEYCYAPSCRHQTREQYFAKPWPRKDIAKKLAKELEQDAPREQVLLSFIGDVYCETHDENMEAHDYCDKHGWEYPPPKYWETWRVMKQSKKDKGEQ